MTQHGLLLRCAALVAAGTSGRAVAAAPASPRDVSLPNIVVVLADDMGWGDPRCNNPGSKIPTPHIDGLAREGIRFTNAHAPAAVCSPTRYGLLTGRYAWRTWMREGVLYNFCGALIKKGRMTIASLLKEHGYRTAGFGKWHLGLDFAPKAGDPGDWQQGTLVRNQDQSLIADRVDLRRPVRNGPLDLGFDRFFGIPHNATARTDLFLDGDRPVRAAEVDPTRSSGLEREMLDDLFTTRAMEFIEAHRARFATRPFFVYLALTAPHLPHLPPQRVRGTSGDGERGDMVSWADDNLGRILGALERLKVAEKTLVIFTSDNGGISIRKDQALRPGDHHTSGPYRGFKTDIWEGGTHVPFIARWPAKIAPGRVTDELVSLTDLLATFAALVGAPALPRWAGEDSFDVLPALLGQPHEAPLRDSLITHSYTGVFALRQGPWKLILDTTGSGGHRGVTPGWAPIITGPVEQLGASGIGQLYDLARDRYETDDLYQRRPDVVKRLTALLAEQRGRGRSREPERSERSPRFEVRQANR